MNIERIKKIKNHRVFQDFSWTNDLPDFNEKNVFYGWNGTGKTTLSNLFRSLKFMGLRSLSGDRPVNAFR